MKYLKKFERTQTSSDIQIKRELAFEEYRKEYQKYFNKYVIVKYKKSGRLDMYKILNLDQEFDLEEYPYLIALPENHKRTAVTITNIDILESYDTLEEAEYNFDLMTTENKFNL